MTHTICTECGGDTHTESLENHRLNNISDSQPMKVRKIVCNHCDATGRIIVSAGMGSTDIRDGPFAELTAEGVKTIRENLEFVPVYEQ